MLDFTRFGGDLLSQGLSPSTIGAKALNFRVRDGTGCFALAMTTKPRKIQQAWGLLDFLGGGRQRLCEANARETAPELCHEDIPTSARLTINCCPSFRFGAFCLAVFYWIRSSQSGD